MNETYAMLAASLMSAGVGYVCGLIVGRDTRPVTTIIRQQWSETTSTLLEYMPEMPVNDSTPPAIKSAGYCQSQGFSPRLASILQKPPDFNGPVYAQRLHGSREWFYCTSAYEMADGRLMQRSTFCGGKEDYEYPVDPGEWRRVK